MQSVGDIAVIREGTIEDDNESFSSAGSFKKADAAM